MQILGTNDLHRARDRGHFSFGTVSSGTKVVYVDLNGLDTWNAQVVAGGTLALTITVTESNSFIPGDDMQAGTAVRDGTWSTPSAAYTVPTIASGGDGFITPADMHPRSAYAKISLVRTGGSGTLDVYLSGKRIGVP